MFAIVSTLEAIVLGWRPSLLDWSGQGKKELKSHPFLSIMVSVNISVHHGA